MTFELTSPYPPIRRVVTGHALSGKSIFVEDKHVAACPFAEGMDWSFTGLYTHDKFPASNQDVSESSSTTGGGVNFTDLITPKPKELFVRTGTKFMAVDIPPGSKSSFHRTVSLDYGIVVKGTLTLILDEGERVILGEGDVIIQRGTIHEWINEGDEWMRAFFVVMPSEKVEIGGKELDSGSS